MTTASPLQRSPRNRALAVITAAVAYQGLTCNASVLSVATIGTVAP